MLQSGRVPNLRLEIEKFLAELEDVEAAIETGGSSYMKVYFLEDRGSRSRSLIRMK